MNLQDLINNGENKRVEFKEKLPKNESIVKTIISFSNTSSGLKEPRILEMNDFVDMEFYRPISVENDRLRPNVTDYDQIVLKYLEENRRITRKEATSILELGETKIKELFNELIDRGLIQRVGAGRGTYYVLENS